MTAFKGPDSEEQILADIRELLYVLAWDMARNLVGGSESTLYDGSPAHPQGVAFAGFTRRRLESHG